MSRKGDMKRIESIVHSVVHATLTKPSRREGMQRLAQYLATLPKVDQLKIGGDEKHLTDLATSYLKSHGSQWHLELRKTPEEQRPNLARDLDVAASHGLVDGWSK